MGRVVATRVVPFVISTVVSSLLLDVIGVRTLLATPLTRTRAWPSLVLVPFKRRIVEARAVVSPAVAGVVGRYKGLSKVVPCEGSSHATVARRARKVAGSYTDW